MVCAQYFCLLCCTYLSSFLVSTWWATTSTRTSSERIRTFRRRRKEILADSCTDKSTPSFTSTSTSTCPRFTAFWASRWMLFVMTIWMRMRMRILRDQHHTTPCDTKLCSYLHAFRSSKAVASIAHEPASVNPTYARPLMLLPSLSTLQFRIQDLTGTFFGKANGPVRVNPISLYRWTEM